MAVLFGEHKENGWLTVHSIQYQIEEHPNGYIVDPKDIPPYPDFTPGVGWVQMYNPETKEWRYDKMFRPHTESEAMLEIAAAIRELAAVLSNK